MKRTAAIKRIKKAAKAKGLSWELDREGSNHTVYRLDGLMIPIARHAELDERYVETLYRECAEKLGQGWWRS